MKNPYPKNLKPVKSRFSGLRHGYPLLWGFGNFLINALPFALIWIASDMNTLAASLAAFFMMTVYCLRENYFRNRRLSEMARQLKEKRNA